MSMTEDEVLTVLALCDKLNARELMDLGSYLIACSFHRKKPSRGTKDERLV